MLKENEINRVLELIIGTDEYNNLITDTVKEYNKKEYNIDDAELILKSYIIAILVVGFSKKQLDINKYSIHLIEKPIIEIDKKEFCKNYKRYINMVENYKFELLRKLMW